MKTRSVIVLVAAVAAVITGLVPARARESADIIIYGHSHRANNEIINGVLFFNPGRARDSWGLLTVGKQVTGEIIALGS